MKSINKVDNNLLDNLTKYHKNFIEKIKNGEEKCEICYISINENEIFSCKSCFKIYHLQCVKDNINSIVISGFKKYTFFCNTCTMEITFNKIPKYNCYCGKYFIAEKNGDKDFDPFLVPHGCGLICKFPLKQCEHYSNKNCEFRCHPWVHQVCEICESSEGNKKIIDIDSLTEKISNLNIDNKNSSSSNLTICINLKGKQNIVGPSCENDSNIVYCGRTNNMGGWKLKQSIWANPFKVTETDTNDIVCKKYDQYIRSEPELLGKLKDLVGKKLACWCVPKPCHTQVLLNLMKEKYLI